MFLRDLYKFDFIVVSNLTSAFNIFVDFPLSLSLCKFGVKKRNVYIAIILSFSLDV